MIQLIGLSWETSRPRRLGLRTDYVDAVAPILQLGEASARRLLEMHTVQFARVFAFDAPGD